LLNELYLYNKLLGNWFFFAKKPNYLTTYNNKIKLFNLKYKFRYIIKNFLINSIDYKNKKFNQNYDNNISSSSVLHLKKLNNLKIFLNALI
jgi:hypothetical protein